MSASAVKGTGYGSDHVWVRGSTAQVGSDHARKTTRYDCSLCGDAFVHRYDVVPNIFDAMKGAGVAEHCPGLARRGPG